MPNTEYLFVYGSLRSGFKSPAYDYISKNFTFVGNAKTKGILYSLVTHPVATSTDKDSFIVGELYVIKNPQFTSYAFAQIDDYEGVVVEENFKPLYIKAKTAVLFNNQIYQAIVYWYNGSIENGSIIESGDVMDF